MYLREHEDGVVLEVKVIPGSARNLLVRTSQESLTVKLTAPPVEGKANKALVKLLGKTLRVPPSSITILRGHASREKIVLISGMDRAGVQARLEGAMTHREEQGGRGKKT
jgi:uncharacterized protein